MIEKEQSASASAFDFLFENTSLTKALGKLGFFAYDVEDDKVFCSELWHSWGYDEQDMRKNRLLEICHPEDREKVSLLLKKALAGAADSHREVFRIRTKEGKWVWILHSGITISRTGKGDLKLYVGTDTDLTPIKEAEEELRLLKIETELRAREAETLQRTAAVITSSLDINETVRLILEQAKIVVPYEKSSVQMLTEDGLEVIGGNGFGDISLVMGLKFPCPESGSLSTLAVTEQRSIICGDVIREFPQFVESEINNPTQSWMGIPLIVHGKVIGLITFDYTVKNFYTEKHLKLASGFAVHVAIALENARLHEQTYRMAMEDALMEIGSRHNFEIQGKIIYEDARRRKNPLALAMVDVDHFKKVNDKYGHYTGDLVLKEIGRLCRNKLRISDMVARYGGEEIVFLFPDTTEATARLIAERLRRRVGEYKFEMISNSITVSIGIASETPSKSSTLQELINKADAALYAAKHGGRDRIEVYTTD